MCHANIADIPFFQFLLEFLTIFQMLGIYVILFGISGIFEYFMEQLQFKNI